MTFTLSPPLGRGRSSPVHARAGAARLLATAILCALATPLPAVSQTVTAAVVRATSDSPELPHAVGGSVSATLEFRPGWSLLVALRRVSDETLKEGRVCRSYSPLVACGEEEIRNDVRLTGFRAAAVRSLFDGRWIGAGVGVGLSFTQVTTASLGTSSGLAGDLYEPRGGQVGVLGMLSAAVAPLPDTGLRLTAGAAVHWVDFNACSEVHYDPFCTSETFREVQIGVSYAFRGPED